MFTVLLLLVILVAFIAMTKGKLEQEVAMPLAALAALGLAGIHDVRASGHDAETALTEGFAQFARIAVLFTAVAVPSHMLQRAGALNWVAMLVGEGLGRLIVRFKTAPFVVVPAVCLFMTYVMAALLHNTTSILVCAYVAVLICKSYQLKPLPVLIGSLVASNLGGFSTAWGDTPNIVEAVTFQLSHRDFFFEIMPINLGLVAILAAVVSFLLSWRIRSRPEGNQFETLEALVSFRTARRNGRIDRRLMLIGLFGLGTAIIGPMIYPKSEIALSSAGIIFCVLAERREHRKDTLLALRIETYATLCAIFILGRVLAHSQIGVGSQLQGWLQASGMSVWSIATASYLGTLLTEAASWATAVSPIIQASAPTHVAAWALGAGVCAGSSSLVTAATAGIILTRETRDNGADSRVTFGSYLIFGLAFSFVMLVYYIIVLSIIWRQ